MKQPGWRWIRAGRASLDGPSLLVNGGCLAYASQSDWAHAQLLAVRLPRPHRALAQAMGRWPQAASGACPGRTGAHPRYLFTLRWLGALPIAMARRRPRPHRELSRYLCQLRDWAQAQSYAAVFQLYAISGRAHFRHWPMQLRVIPRGWAHSQALGGNVSAFHANPTSQSFMQFLMVGLTPWLVSSPRFNQCWI